MFPAFSIDPVSCYLYFAAVDYCANRNHVNILLVFYILFFFFFLSSNPELVMNRHKPVRGFTSPLIAQSRSDIKENVTFANVTKTMVDLTNSQSKSFRSNSQILNLFVTSKEECDTDNSEVKNKSPTKSSASVCVTKVSAADSFETETKKYFKNKFIKNFNIVLYYV